MRLMQMAAALVTAGSLPLGPFIPRLSAQAPEPDPGVAAYVGRHAILEEDLDRWWRRRDPASYERMRREAYEARRTALDALIAEQLLTREATARGVPVDDLLELETRASNATGYCRRGREVHCREPIAATDARGRDTAGDGASAEARAGDGAKRVPRGIATSSGGGWYGYCSNRRA